MKRRWLLRFERWTARAIMPIHLDTLLGVCRKLNINGPLLQFTPTVIKATFGTTECKIYAMFIFFFQVCGRLDWLKTVVNSLRNHMAFYNFIHVWSLNCLTNFGVHLSSPRLLSLSVVRDIDVPSDSDSTFVMQYGQFIDRTSVFLSNLLLPNSISFKILICLLCVCRRHVGDHGVEIR